MQDNAKLQLTCGDNIPVDADDVAKPDSCVRTVRE